MDTNKTRALFVPLIQRPTLTDQLLNRPPFKFLHDIVQEVLKTTGYPSGLFTEDELDSSKASSSRENKIIFLQKLIDVLNIDGQLDELKPAKIVAGKEPELTNILLQSLAIEAAAHKQKNEKRAISKSKSIKTSSKIKEKGERSKERDDSKSRNKASSSKLKTSDELVKKEKVSETPPKIRKTKNEEALNGDTKVRSKEKKSSTSREKSSKDLKDNKEKKKIKSDSSKHGTKVSEDKIFVSALPISPVQQIIQPQTDLIYNSSLPNTQRTPPGRESSGGTSKGDSGVESGIAEETGAESERHDLSERSIAAKNSRQEFIEVGNSTNDVPSQPLRPTTAIGRPQTAIGRPGTAVARPAPPKPKKNIIVTNLNEEETSTLEENKMVNLILDEDKEESKNDDSWWNGDLVVEAEEQDLMSNFTGVNINKLTGGSEEHGVLVNRIIENTRELEKDQIKVDDTFTESDSLDMHERIKIFAEIEGTQKSLQKMTQYVQPMVRTLEFVVDDFDSMLRELEETRKQIIILERELAEQTVNSDSEINKLKSSIQSVDNDIQHVKEQIASSMATILQNETKISEFLLIPSK
ncbi:hypothetical protein Mgra_00000195 [Meloidogyne graminicola]|uniref:TRAF3-interacting protein 1 n=1 Tax=Meloidogyne graminicola TaxID=189291 RepID=A0A8T0A650_9BILA|nr:hypothetical protein Mgra_00000195 [Meloidogyne graminicola]